MEEKKLEIENLTIVFRVTNSDYSGKKVVALFSDLYMAEEFSRCLISNESCDNVMYLIGSYNDL